MATIELIGRITENGDLEINLPPGLPVGEVHVSIELPGDLPWEQRPWTEAEIQELTKFGLGQSGAEIVAALESGELDTSAWVNAGIEDSAAWVEQLRRREESRHTW